MTSLGPRPCLCLARARLIAFLSSGPAAIAPRANSGPGGLAPRRLRRAHERANRLSEETAPKKQMGQVRACDSEFVPPEIRCVAAAAVRSR